MSLNKKPKRTTNFSKTEEEKLVRLALEKKNIFENKKTDAITSKQKDAAWEALAQVFNATSEGQPRSGKVLKDKYNNIKRNIRKTKADLRKEIFLTGGGPPPPKEKEEIPVFNELSDVMGVSVDGLASRHDDDEELYESTKIDAEDEDMLVDEDAEFFLNEDLNTEKPAAEKNVNWQDYNPEMLRTKRHQCLNTSKSKNKKKQKIEGPDTLSDINTLKKKILQQQFENNQEEHEQKLMHAAEEHRMKMQILQAELNLKQNIKF